MRNIDLYLYNTITKRKDLFSPRDPNNVKMYVCGPTVYDRPHLGNIRSAVVYDVLYRLLSYIFPKVTYVRNITDIDDKIIHAAVSSGVNIKDLTERMIEAYEKDVTAVLCLAPTHSPRATQHLEEMFAMIQGLINNRHAYVAENHVLFNVSSCPSYGFLSRRSIEEMIAGARVEVAPYKKHPADFVLWKPVQKGEEEFCFGSPWGLGRPGWHIECSAMSTKYLGENFDVHGGGVDLVFPHHENEVAQATCANKNSEFAKAWLHNGFLTVEGEKMSKSLNNFILLKDLLDKDIPGPVIRYFYLMTHYRKPIDYNQEAIHAANRALMRLANIVEPFILSQYDEDLAACDAEINEALQRGELHKDSIETLCNDMNTPGLLASLFKKTLTKEVVIIASLLGFTPSVLYHYKHSRIDPNVIELAETRENAKKDKNWTIADSIRNEIITRGYNIMDQKEGGYKLTKSLKQL